MSEALIHNNSFDDNKSIDNINRLLSEGKSKFEVARIVGYKGVDGLDRNAKGQGYSWNKNTKCYELNGKADIIQSNSPKIAKILSLIGEGRDLNSIAKYFRMKDSNELADFMKRKGYIWDAEQNNYIKKNMVIAADEGEEECYDRNEDIDIIKLLEANKDKVIELLAYKKQEEIPRYILKSELITKSFYISKDVDDLIKKFSHKEHILQKDIIHTAIIEYLQKYGYSDEVNIMLKS